MDAMKFKITSFIVLLHVLSQTNAFAQIIEVPLSERINQSTYIVEGKVIKQSCFWDKQHASIYTSHQIEIYKILKGKYSGSEIEIITEGGQIGDNMQAASESLELRMGEIGIFFLEPSSVKKGDSVNSEQHLYRTFGGTQGFIKYDLSTKSGNDSFKNYNNICNDIFNPIEINTGQKPTVLKSFTLSPETTLPSKKKCFFSRLCEKNKTKQ